MDMTSTELLQLGKGRAERFIRRTRMWFVNVLEYAFD